MTVDDLRDTTSTAPLPHPRAAGDDAVTTTAAPVRSAPAAGRFPWPEPWGTNRGARPRTEFWDVETASWRSRGPVADPKPVD